MEQFDSIYLTPIAFILSLPVIGIILPKREWEKLKKAKRMTTMRNFLDKKKLDGFLRYEKMRPFTPLKPIRMIGKYV